MQCICAHTINMKTLLKNGTVYDGTGAVAAQVDVLIENDKIVSVAQNIDTVVDKEIDCSGLCVAPGFIDAHSHNDFFIESSESQKYFEPFIRQGVTTQVTGNCGFSPFGVDNKSEHKSLVGGGLFKAENAGSFKDFVKGAVGKLHVNIAPLIGHGTARIGIAGKNSEALDSNQIDALVSCVNEAILF